MDRGFNANDNVVIVQSVIFMSTSTCIGVSKPIDDMETIAEIIGARKMMNSAFFSLNCGKSYPLLIMSPSIADFLAKGERTKDDIRRYWGDNVKVPVCLVEALAWQTGV